MADTRAGRRQKAAAAHASRLAFNWRLWLGAAITAGLLFIAVFGPSIAPYPRDYSEKLEVIQTPSGPETVYPPRPPSARHWLGTDRWGYDLLSLILYGAPFTVFTVFGVAAFRVVLGGLTGMLGGLRAEVQPRGGRGGALSAMPAFIVVFLAMFGINFASPVPPIQLTLIQAGIMVVVGIPAVATVVRQKTYLEMQRPFVTAAVALGARRPRIGARHILPQLRADLLLLMLSETILALNLLGQLGIFQLFLGGTRLSMDPIMYYSITHEWAGLIGQSRASIQANQWTVLAPMGAFVVAVLGLFFLLRGLEEHLHRTQSPPSRL